jgi:hypothetical protein
MSTRRHTICSPVVFGTLILILLLSACSVPIINSTPTPAANSPTSTVPAEQLLSEVEFKVSLPAAIPDKQKLVLEVLDEVTGLALNSTRLEMKKLDDTHYSLKTAFLAGSLVKYRYVRLGGVTAIEYTSLARQVRYRMFYDRNPSVVEDIVSAWNDAPFKSAFGRIQGRVIDSTNNTPIAGSLVSAGGQQVLSASDGSFLLDDLPVGKHNLVIYSLDGAFPPFQQEAIVASESSTPADIRLEPVKIVNITFIVNAPTDMPEGIPMRMIGNTYPLGNTFADLRGGISTIASRAPLLTYLKDRQYAYTIRLPAGLDLRYKFTLGDGFWNAERQENGKFRVRQFIVPDHDQTVEILIDAFTTPGMGAVHFDVDAAAGTGKNEVVSIQFNPFGWTEPIPMWQLGNGHWIYILYTPIDSDLVGEAEYRYCKNDQCGIADDASTSGQDSNGKPFKPTGEPQTIKDTIHRWAWTPENRPTITVTSETITSKPEGFVTGVELLPGYNPSWQAYLGSAFENIKEMHSDWVILSPTWHFLSSNPPVLSEVPGLDATWYDLSRMGALAREKGLHIAVHPSTAYYQPSAIWWQTGTRDSNWWQSWFDRYETFVLNHADYANQIGADALVLGDETLAPALPDGKLFDGTSSGVPQDISLRWSALLRKIRTRYSGKIIWRLDYPSETSSVPDFVKDVDEIYLVMNGKLSDVDSPNVEILRGETASIVENDIRTIRDQFSKPFLLGIAYPSVNGAAKGCILSGEACLPQTVFEQAGLDLPALTQNLAEQADIYNAVFEALNQNDWINGIVASGYYPAVSLQDKSNSIRGKPAADVVWFWFSHFLGAGQ